MDGDIRLLLLFNEGKEAGLTLRISEFGSRDVRSVLEKHQIAVTALDPGAGAPQT